MSTGVSGELTEGSPRFSTITPLVRYELQRFSVRREEAGQCLRQETPTSPHTQHSIPTPQEWNWGVSGSLSPSPASLSSQLSQHTGMQRVRMAAQVGNQSRFILLLAASPQDTGAADMGLQ